MAEVINGKKISEDILEKLKALPRLRKFLAVISAGENMASQKFIERKKDFAKKLGLDFRLYKLEAGSNDFLRREIGRIAGQGTCGGAIVQLPLPENINRRYVLNAIPPEKDPDCLGEKDREDNLLAPSVETVKEILAKIGISLSEATAAVLGQGFLTGKPIALWLKNEAKETIIVDQGDDIKEIMRADIVISGVGKPGLFSAKQLKPGAGVIDFGTSFADGKLKGDFDAQDSGKISFCTPTPGGTGPILVAKLFENFYKLNSE